MIQHAIEMNGVVKRYGDHDVVDHLDLSIEAGTTVSILGPNGAGKTTTVEMCEGHRRPSAGTLRVLGQEPWTAGSAWRDRIGVVTQETGAFDRLTVAEAVGHLAGFYSRRRTVTETLSMVGMDDRSDVRVDALSGGQRRRLDLACGLVGRPDLLFLDEPTTGLDPEARRQLWEVVRSLRDEGVTIVLTTHLLDEAEALADRVIVLVGGRVVADATPGTIGGRNTAEAVVAFVPPDDRPLDGALDDPDPGSDADPGEPAPSRSKDGRVSLRSRQPARLIARLVAHYDADLPELTVTRGTLEDAYLRLIDDDRGAR